MLSRDKWQGILLTKDDAVLNKYNLEAITQFIIEKFANLSKTYEKSDLAQKKTLLCPIFPSGVPWSYPGYSNTELSPYCQSIFEFENPKVALCADERTRTSIPLREYAPEAYASTSFATSAFLSCETPPRRGASTNFATSA